jgi:hypothetical protein
VEGQDGLITEIDTTRPTLVRRWEKMCDEHIELLQQLQEFQSGLRTAPAADLGSLRQQAALIVQRINEHLEAEAALLLESHETDLGAGD